MPTEHLSPSDITLDSDRYRADYGDLEALKSSIERYGIIQPLIVDQDNVLVDGGRRLRAAIELGLPTVPITRKGAVSESLRRELELESNMARKDFTWQEQVTGVCTVHRARLREARLAGEEWSLERTGLIVGNYGSTFVHYCLYLEPRLADKALEQCTSVTDAARICHRLKADEAMAALAKVTPVAKASNDPVVEATIEASDYSCPENKVVSLAGTTQVVLSGFLFNGDCIPHLAFMDAESIDHVITDPPYAIPMENLQQTNIGGSVGSIARVEETHEVKANLGLLHKTIPLLARVLKPGGFLIMWCDPERFQWIADLAISAELRVQRWPFVWCKTSPCKNGAPHYNFTKNYEIALVARKGHATLPTPVPSSWILAGNDARCLSNAFAKPFDVWRRLIESVSLVGQTILDPFAGEGTCPLAALALDRQVIAIEQEATHYNYMLESVKQHYLGKHPNCIFV